MISEVTLPSGQKLINVPANEETLRQLGLPKDQRDAYLNEHKAAKEALKQKNQIRADIINSVGDIPSLVGTNADATALLMYHLGKLLVQMADANTSHAKNAEAAAPLTALLKQFSDGVDQGTIKLPHMVKGDESTAIDEIAARCTGVADIMATARGVRR